MSDFAGGVFGFGEQQALVLAGLGVGALLIVIFARHSLRLTGRPLLDLRLFAVPTFSASIRLLFLSSIVFYGGIFVLPLLLAHKTSMSNPEIAFMAGVHGFGALLSRPTLQTLTWRFGNRASAFGAIAVTAAGTAPLLMSTLYALSLIHI